MKTNAKKRSKVNTTAVIEFPVPAAWKGFLKKELKRLKVPRKGRDAFYRGAILAGISDAWRAKDPRWQKFLKAVQPKAKKYLGGGICDDGLKSILKVNTCLWA